jgi:hypothetical protein
MPPKQGGSEGHYKLHDKVYGTWADGTVHEAEIVDERVRRGAPAKSPKPEDKEYYVHYIDCEWLGLPWVCVHACLPPQCGWGAPHPHALPASLPTPHLNPTPRST